MQGETWKQVAGYEGLYEVSSYGRVRSLPHYAPHGRRDCLQLVPGRLLKPRISKNGYAQVNLCRGTKDICNYYIHRLVAQHFLAKPDSCDVVNHLDFNRQNNAATNLEWGTTATNNAYTASYGKFCAIHNPKRARRLSHEKVKGILAARATGATFASIAAQYGIAMQTAHRVCSGELWRGAQ